MDLKVVKIITVFVFCICLTVTNCMAQVNKAQPLRTYWLVLYSTGSRFQNDTVAAGRIKDEHNAFLKALVAKGIVKTFGPFTEGKPWRAMAIFECDTREILTNSYLSQDPVSIMQYMKYDIYPYLAPVMEDVKKKSR